MYFLLFAKSGSPQEKDVKQFLIHTLKRKRNVHPDTRSIWWSKILFLDLGILSVFFTHMKSSGRLLRAGGRGWHTSRRHCPGKKKMEVLSWCRRERMFMLLKKYTGDHKVMFPSLFSLFWAFLLSICLCSLNFYCVIYCCRRIGILSLPWVKSMEQSPCSIGQSGSEGGVRQGRNNLNTDCWGQPAWPGASVRGCWEALKWVSRGSY